MTEVEEIVAWLHRRADETIRDASYCRSGNSGESLRRKARQFRDIAADIERRAHLQHNEEQASLRKDENDDR